MSKTYWRIRHVGTMSLLPKKLEKGRAYFVEDEQVIVVDMGRGPVIYGGKPGPQGQAGEPLPQIQDQIDKLSEAALYTQDNIWRLTERSDKRNTELHEKIDTLNEQTQTRITQEAQIAQDYTDALHEQTTQSLAATAERITQEAQTAKDYTDQLADRHTTDFTHITQLINDKTSRLQDQIDHLTEAILSFINTVQEKFTSYDQDLATIAKTISNLYPSPYAEETADPLDGETLTTDAGTWTIQQTNLEDGTIMLELEAQELLIDTLQVGDKVDYDGTTWTVSSKETEDGLLRIELTP